MTCWALPLAGLAAAPAAKDQGPWQEGPVGSAVGVLGVPASAIEQREVGNIKSMFWALCAAMAHHHSPEGKAHE